MPSQYINQLYSLLPIIPQTLVRFPLNPYEIIYISLILMDYQYQYNILPSIDLTSIY